MPLKIFVSSEMTSKNDKERRSAMIQEIEELGHDPVFFEDLPGRPLPEDQNALDKCREMVSKSDILIAIIDDTVTHSIETEIEVAAEILGHDKIFYYFTKTNNRDNSAKKLWNNTTKGYIVKEFKNSIELRKQIKRSIGSYIEDVICKKEKTGVIFNEVIALKPNKEWHQPFEFKRGDIVTVTCLGDSKFFAGLYPRKEYVDRRGPIFSFEIGSDATQDTGKIIIPETDDYYLVLRKSLWHTFPVKVHVKIKVEKP